LEAGSSQVLLLAERSHDLGERPKVGALDDERVLLEERNDPLFQIRSAADCVGQHAALRTLRADNATAEERAQCFGHRSMRLVLVHVEDRLDLPVARGSDEWIPMEADTEAALAIDEADDPARIELERVSGFLLIVRTGRIVTAHYQT